MSLTLVLLTIFGVLAIVIVLDLLMVRANRR